MTEQQGDRIVERIVGQLQGVALTDAQADKLAGVVEARHTAGTTGGPLAIITHANGREWRHHGPGAHDFDTTKPGECWCHPTELGGA